MIDRKFIIAVDAQTDAMVEKPSRETIQSVNKSSYSFQMDRDGYIITTARKGVEFKLTLVEKTSCLCGCEITTKITEIPDGRTVDCYNCGNLVTYPLG